MPARLKPLVMLAMVHQQGLVTRRIDNPGRAGHVSFMKFPVETVGMAFKESTRAADIAGLNIEAGAVPVKECKEFAAVHA
jgi:hypothetical protein